MLRHSLQLTVDRQVLLMIFHLKFSLVVACINQCHEQAICEGSRQSIAILVDISSYRTDFANGRRAAQVHLSISLFGLSNR